MQCQFCHTPLKAEATICSSCGRFVDSQVEQLIDQAVTQTLEDSPQAGATFRQAASQVRPQDRAYLQQRMRYLLQQAHQAAPVEVEDQTMVGTSLPAAGSLATPPASQPPDASPPRDVAAPPAGRSKPPAGKGNRTVFVDFNQSPREIVQVMNETQQNAQAFNRQRKKQKLLLWLLFPLGLPFVLADLALGYNICTFSLVALTLWISAFVGLILLARRGKTPQFGPKFDLARTVFTTLKDDVSPKRTLTGWLDLTGAEQESKATRQKTSQSGQPIIYYRDEWLRFKTSLYDGNVLRISLVERVKARQGFWKRSRSGKHKWRAGRSDYRYQLQFSVSATPGSYDIQPLATGVKIPNSRFVVEQAEAGNDRIVLKAVTAETYDAWDVLNAMRFGYDHLQKV